MSQRLVTSKSTYKSSRKIYGALDLIEKTRNKHSQGSHRYSVKKNRGKKDNALLKNSEVRANEVSRVTEVLDKRERTKLSQLLTLYGEQNSPAYRQGFDIRNYRPHRSTFPDLTTQAVSMARGSVLRTSSHLSGLQDKPPSLTKTQALTLPDINKKPLV